VTSPQFHFDQSFTDRDDCKALVKTNEPVVRAKVQPKASKTRQEIKKKDVQTRSSAA